MRFASGRLSSRSGPDRPDTSGGRLSAAHKDARGAGSGDYHLHGRYDHDSIARVPVATGHIRASAEDTCRIRGEGSPGHKYVLSTPSHGPADTRLQRIKFLLGGLLYDGAHRGNPD